jgi:hypothetical protein
MLSHTVSELVNPQPSCKRRHVIQAVVQRTGLEF